MVQISSKKKTKNQSTPCVDEKRLQALFTVIKPAYFGGDLSEAHILSVIHTALIHDSLLQTQPSKALESLFFPT